MFNSRLPQISSSTEPPTTVDVQNAGQRSSSPASGSERESATAGPSGATAFGAIQRAGGSSTAARLHNDHRQQLSTTTTFTASDDEDAAVLMSIADILMHIGTSDAGREHSPQSAQELTDRLPLTAEEADDVNKHVAILLSMSRASNDSQHASVPDATAEMQAALGMLAMQPRRESELAASYELLAMSSRQGWARPTFAENRASLERLPQEVFDIIRMMLDEWDIRSVAGASTALLYKFRSPFAAYMLIARMKPIALAGGRSSLVKLARFVRLVQDKPMLLADRDAVRLTAVAKVRQLPGLVIPSDIIEKAFHFFAHIVDATEGDAARVEGMEMLRVTLSKIRFEPADAARTYFFVFKWLVKIAGKVKSREYTGQAVFTLVAFSRPDFMPQNQESRFQRLAELTNLICSIKDEVSASKAISELSRLDTSTFDGNPSDEDIKLASDSLDKIRAKVSSFANLDRALASDIAVRAAFLTHTHADDAVLAEFNALLAEGENVVSDEGRLHLVIAFKSRLHALPDEERADKLRDILTIVESIEDPKLMHEAACELTDCIKLLEEVADCIDAINALVTLTGKLQGKTASNRLVAKIAGAFYDAFDSEDFPDDHTDAAMQSASSAHARLVAMADFEAQAENRTEMVFKLLKSLIYVSAPYEAKVFVDLLAVADRFNDDEKADLLNRLSNTSSEPAYLCQFENEGVVRERLIQFVAGINGERQKGQGVVAIAKMKLQFGLASWQIIFTGLKEVIEHMPDGKAKRDADQALQPNTVFN